jgi:DNA-binding winged helix-turn-helix (wHTH) protein
MIHLGATFFDESNQMLRDAAGTKIALRAQALRVLECLIKAKGKVAVTDDSLIQYIGEIGLAIGDAKGDAKHLVLQTEHRRGYRLVFVDNAVSEKPVVSPESALHTLTHLPRDRVSQRLQHVEHYVCHIKGIRTRILCK